MTIAAMLALGFTTRYSGEDATLGFAFAQTGVLYPFFSGVLLGWIGSRSPAPIPPPTCCSAACNASHPNSSV